MRFEVAAEIARALESRFSPGFVPRAGLILGSGLGAALNRFEVAHTIEFAELPGFPRAGVAGHRGRVVACAIHGVDAVVFAGRPHIYENGSVADAALPARLMAALGAEIVIVTNAAGGINRGFAAGDLMAIRDHIDLTFRAHEALTDVPLLPTHERVGVPGVGVYDEELLRFAAEAAAEIGFEMRTGVYAAMSGPSYETRAEVRMLELFGCDAVGMSTVPEVIAARALGMRVFGVSCIANPACGLGTEPLGHAEVIEATGLAAGRLGELIAGVLGRVAVGSGRP